MIAKLQMLQQLYLCFKGGKKILLLTKTELLNFKQFVYSINVDNIREIIIEKDVLPAIEIVPSCTTPIKITRTHLFSPERHLREKKGLGRDRQVNVNKHRGKTHCA